MFSKTFFFGLFNDLNSSADTYVSAGDLYSPEKGYGFVTETNRRQQELLRFAELNSGFDTFYWYQDEDLTVVKQDAYGCFVDSEAIMAALAEKEGGSYPGESRKIPMSFKMDVPGQGNYRVDLEISMPGTVNNEAEPDKADEEFLIFIGRRHLAWKGSLAAGETLKLAVVANVCDIVPRGQEEIYEDTTLDVTVVADKPRLTAMRVEAAEVPTVYIAGDSTVTDQSASYPYSPGTSYSGWGQMISAYLNGSIAVSNHAHSGLTTDSFRKEGHYSIVEKYWKPDDYYFIQFGHNDQKLDELKAREGYRENILTYIKEARAKGAYPVIITPIARNTWKGNDGTYNDLLEEYAASCFEIGQDADVPVLDLHGLSMAFVKEKGVEAAKPYFFPNDYTHSDDYGAYHMAGYVAGQMKEICGKHKEEAYRFLADCVTEGFGIWQPVQPICLPEKPAIYEDIKGPEMAELLSDVDRLEEAADRASVLDMLIKTCRFFPTNVYNDMFVDVVGHEWYAGAVECAYQNGIIVSELVEEDHFYPERSITLEEFIVFAMNGYQSRKPLPQVDALAVNVGSSTESSGVNVDKFGAYAGKCRDFALKFVNAAAELGLIPADGSADMERIITRGEAVDMCRKMHI